MAGMTGREKLLGVVGAATYWGAPQVAPPDYTKPLTDAGLIVLGVWLALMSANVLVNLIERFKGTGGGLNEQPQDPAGPVAERLPSEGD